MAVEVFTDDPFPSSPGPPKHSVSTAPSSFHNEAFPAPITIQASTLCGLSVKRLNGSRNKIKKRPSRSAPRPPLPAPTMSDSEQDKRRNKLGYQRISIACAHCRRRKIRCLLADKDPQGRCQNCIRLKKECVFYPIDQQTAYESRSDPTASSSGVSSHSPDVQAPHGRSRFSPLPPTTQGLQGMPTEPSATFSGHYIPVERSYPETLPSNSPWPPAASRGFEMPSHTLHSSPGPIPQTQYWAFDQSPGSGDFAPFPNEPAQQVRTPSTTFTATFPQSSPEQAWHLQQPHQLARSMSYPLRMASMLSSQPEYAPSYATNAPQQMPSASFSPFSVPVESPSMMGQMQGPPFTPPIPQSQSFSEHGGYHDYRGPPDHQHQHGAMPVQQGYPGGWYSNSTGLGVSMDVSSSIPPHALPPYVVPSQRPR